MNQLLDLFPDFVFSGSRNSTGDAVLFFCYSDVHLRSSVTLFNVVFLFAPLQGVIVQLHNKTTIIYCALLYFVFL